MNSTRFVNLFHQSPSVCFCVIGVRIDLIVVVVVVAIRFRLKSTVELWNVVDEYYPILSYPILSYHSVAIGDGEMSHRLVKLLVRYKMDCCSNTTDPVRYEPWKDRIGQGNTDSVRYVR